MWIDDPIVKRSETVKMSKSPHTSDDATYSAAMDAPAPAPRLRADARKNEEAILEAAKHVFASSGVDAPIREIAGKAGVGLGTLYRRFPTRADLIAAVFRREVDVCADAALTLSADSNPLDALSKWLMHYTGFLATKQGLAAALRSGDATFATLPEYFRQRFEPALARLLAAAADAGEVRNDIAPFDLLRAIGNLSVSSSDDGIRHTERMIRLLIDGLRYGAHNNP